MKARRTTDAIPQRGSAGIISDGNGGLKWRTNFSKTSSERNVHALRLFFPPLFPPFFSLSLSLFFLSLCCVSETTPLFYQINISQNKSQDNFKLVREERGGRKRETGKRGRENLVQFARFLWSGVSVFLHLSFWGLWFCRLRLGVSSI